jgi:hypothetical protein
MQGIALAIRSQTPPDRSVASGWSTWAALLAERLSNRAIAARLPASETAIKSHMHHLIGKFGVSTRGEVLVRARTGSPGL